MALYDCMVSMHEYAVQCYTLRRRDLPEQTGHDMPTSTLYGVFRAEDGDLVIAAQVDDAWKRFAALIGGERRPGWLRHRHALPHARRGAMRIALEVLAWCASLGRRAAVARMLSGGARRASTCRAPRCRRIDEVLADPQIVARGMVVEQEHPLLGTVRLPNLPFRFSDCDTTIREVGAGLSASTTRKSRRRWASNAAEIDAMQPTACCYAK